MEKSDQQFIKNIRFFFVFSICLMVFSVAGILLAGWGYFFRLSTPGELVLSRIIIWFSIALFFSANIHFQAFKTIKRLSDQIAANQKEA
jgi:hypothetical protein